MSRHRAPRPPLVQLLGRVNRALDTRARVAGIALAAFGVSTLAVVGIAAEVAPVVRVSEAPVFERVQEPTGRGGPVAPIFDVVSAPHYEPMPPPVAVVTAQPTAPPATVAPRACRCTPRTRATESERPPVMAASPTTPRRAPDQAPDPAPVTPPVVGLPPVTEPTPEPDPEPVEEEPAVDPNEPTEPVDEQPEPAAPDGDVEEGATP